MGRFYTVKFTAVAVTAAQDLFEILAGSARPFLLHEIRVTQSSDAGDAESEQLRFSVSRAASSYTSGSGGSTHTPTPHMSSDAAATATAEINNTTRAAAGSGTLTEIFSVSENIHNGWHYLPTPEARLTFAGSQACVIGLETAPADSLTMSGYAVIEELA